ncbi:hypothetical protein A3D00_02765 [Candidatus Woesebacteria bacterium RIFCSPHIGHO2_02_FULL_38_9]|uniref:Uncharacterized protein n=1 Tax=Candidatus Woesebacteria bacterium RIFCSPHIGHO2_01_FULL_39_28 TaxID=1802496 RepID=A0A1F7YGK3_9BACT|nr:MAG: hypothetical protein A2627_04355 [Candidatus Woesebacteria bacterium RIFCSPHIGHO2_01_FULL_39_28]OGM35172.1 MAG: hypothetical protein A3D00_02765 [Candidatus Woesebacteria bacterium RIFCSPHIGHO2_02_FULL_38_9]OGM57762.1 MAG: hypothetical protein A3A50_05615 [Candidatus Woesebacteria bacterium RIFCSPLOWO2_01_FULL_38_20]
MSRKTIKKVFITAPSDKVFWLRSGQSINDLGELSRVLKTISDEDFYYHVSKEKNDFANWIEEVLDDGELAEKMRRKWTKNQILYVIDNHIKTYYEKGQQNV